MQSIAPLLSAVASLLWALFAFAVLGVFKNDISMLLRRISKANILGQSLELNRELDKLERSSTIAEEIVDSFPRSTVEVTSNLEGQIEAQSDNNSGDGGTDIANIDEVIKDILKKAATSPKLALIGLSAELERQARQALAVRGILKEGGGSSLFQYLTQLEQYGFPSQLIGSLKLFSDVRNQIVHGRNASDDDALRAIDSGIVIMRTLDSMPRSVNIVYKKDVPVYSDEACSSVILDATGVILEITSPGGTSKSFHVFPTTKTHFVEGREVAWEWNNRKQWAAAWYRDLQTGAATQAWVSSMEFIGRPLRDI